VVCGELLALQPIHIDSKRNIVLMQNAKEKKDRIVISLKILLLRDYYLPLIYALKNIYLKGQLKEQAYDDYNTTGTKTNLQKQE
jgi:integrase/recombinase XerD